MEATQLQPSKSNKRIALSLMNVNADGNGSFVSL
jgi:hypothetical protein